MAKTHKNKHNPIAGAETVSENTEAPTAASVDGPTDQEPREPIIDRDDTADGVGESATPEPTPDAAGVEDLSLRRCESWSHKAFLSLAPVHALSDEQVTADIEHIEAKKAADDKEIARIAELKTRLQAEIDAAHAKIRTLDDEKRGYDRARRWYWERRNALNNEKTRRVAAQRDLNARRAEREERIARRRAAEAERERAQQREATREQRRVERMNARRATAN